MKPGVLLPTFGLLFAAAASQASPESETLRLSKLLHPIPDEEWQNIAGTHMTESYDINRGDTLWDISTRLFGDGKYWPKVWALNNSHITNPHLIRPGVQIAFEPGTGTSLPALTLNLQSAPTEAEEAAPGPGTAVAPGGAGAAEMDAGAPGPEDQALESPTEEETPKPSGATAAAARRSGSCCRSRAGKTSSSPCPPRSTRSASTPGAR